MPDTRPVQSNAVANSSNACPDNLGEAMWQLKIEDCRGGADAIPNLYPDRPGEPDCIYYLRTGYCGYGSNCRYNHPNYIGQGTLYTGVLPERDGQPDCQFFLKTGTCKFGVTCKYHHPRDNHEVRQVQLNILGLPMRKGGVNHVPSTDVAGPKQISYPKHHALLGSSAPVDFPERPDQPQCQYYMKTGSCKFGTSCKFHHPKERNQEAICTIGPLGLPLRPGQPLCTFYSMYGSCKYGSTCKFDHPFMGYNYTLPAFSVPDPPVLFPNRRNSQAMRMLAEDSDSKTVRLPDQHVKYETSDEPQDANDHNHGNSSTQVSPSHTARHSESPGKCSD
ncbi:zinc finger CCCH domain-containing protein 66-like isoform X3 [Phoenix dactylifera]|uniref:Zinc finger CCCH domain-containing protein 66-like isoform X3 n=1 Tax=Phoenix dactylifera TaxID=42345 RepID=A0A8B7CHI7_PHODC|nr:zinc finger CCCH domain-containing protein 66-like isoform X3 [Phoenix dactylifera]